VTRSVAILTLLRVAAIHNGRHRYLSTYCLHGLHAACRLTCKTCGAPCRCDCHDHPPPGDTNACPTNS
jgi:hypothetical protein